MSWYYARGNQQMGPVEVAELQRLQQQGELTARTLVFGPGMSDWMSLADTEAAGFLKLHAATAVAGSTEVTTEPQTAVSAPYADVGEAVPENSIACPTCGRQVAANELIPVQNLSVCIHCRDETLQRLQEGHGLKTSSPYADFWDRVLALLVDGGVDYGFGLVIQFSVALFVPLLEEGNLAATLFSILFLFIISLMPLTYRLYMMGHERHRGTLGMKLVKIQIIRPNGDRVSRWRLFGRAMASALSAFFLIGYFWMLWDEENRTLHDIIADTRVIKAGGV